MPRRRPFSELTPTERRVVSLVVQRGLTNPEIAKELAISKKAVEYHLTNIYGKTGVSNRIQLVLHIVRNGLLDRV